MLIEALGPRNERGPQAYADLILGAVMNALMNLGDIRNEKEFEENYFDPTRVNVRGGFGSDELWKRYSNPTDAPEGKSLITRKLWAFLAVAYAIEAIEAADSGDTSRAWSLVADGLIANGALMSAASDQVAYTTGKKYPSQTAAAARVANDPKQIAKSKAFQLWKDRHVGKHPSLRTNEQFAMECLRQWPQLTSIKVILGWCTTWTKEEKKGFESYG